MMRRAAGLVVIALWGGHLAGQSAAKTEVQKPKPSPPDVALNEYIARVRAESLTQVLTPGSIWGDPGRLIGSPQM